MRLSTPFRYGARAMTELGAAYPDRAVPVREIAEKQRISAKYLEHIFRPLKAAGLVRVVRGMRGGYALARPPARIRLKELYETLIGSAAPADCVDCPESCPRHDVCPTRDTWVEIKKAVERVLERTTIKDLVERRNRKAVRSTRKSRT